MKSILRIQSNKMPGNTGFNTNNFEHWQAKYTGTFDKTLAKPLRSIRKRVLKSAWSKDILHLLKNIMKIETIYFGNIWPRRTTPNKLFREWRKTLILYPEI
jgi:hypothetical protein